MERILTTCGYCGCGCNFYYNVENGEIIGVTPMNNHPVSQGKLCVKGWHGFEFVNSRDRLKVPMLRDKADSFYPVSWERAIDEVHKRLKKIIDEYGVNSVGILSSARCTNEENYLTAKFARAVLKTPNIDHCARL